jgi:hypothetical protein
MSASEMNGKDFAYANGICHSANKPEKNSSMKREAA